MNGEIEMSGLRPMATRVLALASVALLMAACAAEYGTPIAAPGTDMKVDTGSVVQLDGSSSSDPDSLPLRYQWRFAQLPPGSDAVLNDSTIVNPSFTADVDGDYVLVLVVSNGVRTSAAADVTVTAGPCGRQAPEIAGISVEPSEPGIDQTVFVSAAVLDADYSSACGGEGDGALGPDSPYALEWRWRMIQKPVGSAAALNDPAVQTPSFTPDVAGAYVLELVVIDEHGLASAPAFHTVDVSPCGGAAPEIAGLAADPEMPDIGELVTLSADYDDADNGDACALGQELRAQWAFVSVPAGSEAQINDPGVDAPSFVPDAIGTYVVRLVVVDETMRASAPAYIEITTTECHTAPPTVDAIAVAPEAPNTDDTIQLSAAITDPDAAREGCEEDPALTWTWRLVALPPGSRASLNNAEARNPSFTADVPGQYVVDLVVTDAYGLASGIATHAIDVSVCGDAAPSAQVEVVPGAPATGDIVQLAAAPVDADTEEPCGRAEEFDYAWAIVGLPAGSQATLNAAASRTPSFHADVPGAYALRLVVTDQSGRVSDPIDTVVDVSPCGARAPSVGAVAAAPAAPNTGDLVQLSAPVSDPDAGEPCNLPEVYSWRWWFVDVPAGSAAQLNAPMSEAPSFVADRPGSYVVRVEASDATGLWSDPVDFTVDVSDCGDLAPVIEQLTASPAAPNAGQAVQLTAQVSDADTDVDGCGLVEAFEWHWTMVALPAGSQAALNDTRAMNPSFTADVPGSYSVELMVTDRFGNMSAAERITVDAGVCGTAAPIAAIDVITPDPIAGDRIILAANPTDADNAAPCGEPADFTYLWRFVDVPPGSVADFNVPTSATVSFDADVPGTYIAELIVSDRAGNQSAPAPVQIVVDPCGANPPVVAGIAAAPAAPLVGDVVTVLPDASDADNAIGDEENPGCGLAQALTWHWRFVSIPAGSQAALNDAAVRQPSFTADVAGDYLLELVVMDDTGRVSDATPVAVTVDACGGFAPTVDAIDADPGRAPQTGVPVVLSYTASDRDNDPACDLGQNSSAEWRFVSLPAGSMASLNDPLVDTPTFTPDVPGDYVLDVTVTDETGRSSPPTRIAIAARLCGAEAPIIDGATFGTAPGAGEAILGQPVSLSIDVADPDNAEGCDAGQTLTWGWRITGLPAGSAATLNDASLGMPSFIPDLPGTYRVMVDVTDDTGRVGTAGPYDIVVDECGGHTPVADIAVVAPAADDTSPATVSVGDVVQVSGAGSADADNDEACGLDQPIFYGWQILEAPVGASVFLSDSGALNPWFVPDAAGRYVLRLFVSDGDRTSAPAEFTINAN